MEVAFEDISTADLAIDTVYKGGKGSEMLSKLLPGCSNSAIFRYYGDNRNQGKTILDTPRKGNMLLEFVFDCLNSKDGEEKPITHFE